VVRVHRDADEDRLGLLAEPETHDPVVFRGRVVGVDEPVVLVVWREREAQQPALAGAVGGERLHLLGLAGRADREHPSGVALGDEGVAVRKEGHVPRRFEVRGEHRRLDLDRPGLGRGARVFGRRVLGGGRFLLLESRLGGLAP
jgi:hypothetical protein